MYGWKREVVRMKGSAREAQEGDLYTLDEFGRTKEMGLTLALTEPGSPDHRI